MLDDIRKELSRLSANEFSVSEDDEFDPAVGTTVEISDGDSYWHLLPHDFEQILEELPDNAGNEAVKEAIEAKAQHVWHGPEPNEARE